MNRERPESIVHNALQNLTLTTPLPHNTIVGKEPSLSLTGLWEIQIQTIADMLNKQTKQYRDRSSRHTEHQWPSWHSKSKNKLEEDKENWAKGGKELPHIL